MKARCLPFSQIPHTTRLFTDLLASSSSTRPFYPQPPYLKDWVKGEASRISYDASRRQRVAGILERQSNFWGASAKTLGNIERLRDGAAALVTGQQVGLFGGPMFSIYKALTAVKLAEQATAAGVDTVPVFWLATYDHDLAEVNQVSLPNAEGTLQTFSTPTHGAVGAPVADVRFGDEILPPLNQIASLLGDGEATALLRDAYRPGETFGTAFARLYAKLFADWGVIVLDASDGALHRIAEPIYRGAIERAGEIVAALLARGSALEAAGYHQQVRVLPSSVLVFTMKDGARTAIRRLGEGAKAEFLIGDEESAERISQAELLRRLASTPEQFTPNVLLRPVVEDYLLPTLAYTGGAAEAAYFGQAGAIYEILLGRTTPIIPRYSATIVEPKVQRLLERHGIALPDVFAGPEELRRNLAANNLPEDLHAAFEAAKQSVDSNVSALKENLIKLDRTLFDAAETARSKMQYQLERLYTQAARAELQKGELVSRHAETLTQALYPDKGLQERGIGGIYFVARYGRDLLHQIHDSMPSDCHDHQVIEI